jgi:hypothetical protein
MTFWQSNIPDFPEVYRDALDRWRVDTISDLGFRQAAPGGSAW